MLKRIAGFGIALALSTFLAAPAVADVYDLATDWSDVSNPNGAWTYRAGNATLPLVTDWTPLSNGDSNYGSPAGAGPHIAQPAWAQGTAGGAFLPAWFRAAVTPAGANLQWQLGDIVVHTTDTANGGAAGPANIIWTAPGAGSISIAGGIWDARTDLNREQDWELYVNGILVDFGSLLGTNDAISRSTPDPISFNGTIQQNQIVELRVFRQANEPFGDFVGLNLTVNFEPEACTVDCPTQVPEPTTWAVFGAGLAGLAAMRRRRQSIAG